MFELSVLCIAEMKKPETLRFGLLIFAGRVYRFLLRNEKAQTVRADLALLVNR